jgi:hypothetical protein
MYTASAYTNVTPGGGTSPLASDEHSIFPIIPDTEHSHSTATSPTCILTQTDGTISEVRHILSTSVNHILSPAWITCKTTPSKPSTVGKKLFKKGRKVLAGADNKASTKHKPRGSISSAAVTEDVLLAVV